MHDLCQFSNSVISERYITLGRIYDAATTIPLLVIEHDYHFPFVRTHLHIVAHIETIVKH